MMHGLTNPKFKGFVLSVCPPARMEQLGSHWTSFHKISYLGIFRKSVEKIHISLKSYKNNRYFTWRPKYICYNICLNLRSQWPRGLRRMSAAARLLRSWARIPPEAWMFVVSGVLSGRDLCDELIARPEESYRPWCVVVCDLETSRNGAPYIYIYIYIYMTLVA